MRILDVADDHTYRYLGHRFISSRRRSCYWCRFLLWGTSLEVMPLHCRGWNHSDGRQRSTHGLGYYVELTAWPCMQKGKVFC